MRFRQIFLLFFSISSLLIVHPTRASSPTIKSYGTIRAPTIYFPHTGEGDFEKFPFRGSVKGVEDWEWVNGYQMDLDGNLYAYGDCGVNPSVYIKQSTEHVQHGRYSAEFHLGTSTEPTHTWLSNASKHCKLYEEMQRDYPDSYLRPADGQPKAYYSAWYWFPSDFQVVDWKLILQWYDPRSGTNTWPSGLYGYSPALALIWGETWLELRNNRGYREADPQGNTKYVSWSTGYTVQNIPKEQWVHIEVFVKMGSAFLALDGRAIVWIDEKQVLDVAIGLYPYWTEQAGLYNVGLTWGVGNYCPKESTGSIWIDNVQVADSYISG